MACEDNIPALNTKANRNLDNQSEMADWPYPKVILSNGDWYIKWKSGFIEQGGSTTPGGGWFTKTFAVPFTDKTTIWIGSSMPAISTDDPNVVSLKIRYDVTTLSSFRGAWVYGGSSYGYGASGGRNWYACGW